VQESRCARPSHASTVPPSRRRCSGRWRAAATLNNTSSCQPAGYQDNSARSAVQPEKSKQLLDEAGWKLEGACEEGRRALEIHCVIPTGVATSRQESELIQNMLAQLGVTMTITAVPLDDFFDK